MIEPKTVNLNNGCNVLAREGKHGLCAIGYANRTQAYNALAKLGAGWYVAHWGRPF
jgi:hypothetical protein